MLPNIQVGADVIATQGTTLSLSFLVYDLVSLDTTEGGFHKVVVESDQHGAEHRGRPKRWEFPFFSCSPWESAESVVKDLLGLLWPPDWREGRVESRKGVVWYEAGHFIFPL